MADHRTGNRDRGSSIFSDDSNASDNERWRSNQAYRGGQQPQQNQGDDRGFFSKAGDEVRSWFGDEEAEHRREEDARRWEREHGESSRYRGGGHDDQWRGGPVDEDRGYAGTGRNARDWEQGRFRGGSDRDDLSGYGQRDYGQRDYGQRGSGQSNSGQSYGQGGQSDNRGSDRYGQDRPHQPSGQQGGGKYGQGQYGQSSFGEGNHGNTGAGQWNSGQRESHSGWDTYGQPETPQSGRYGQIGQPSYGQQSGANRDQFGHYGSEQDYGRAGGTSGQSDQGGRFGGSPHDASYRRWRDQQMETLDRDYEDYCRHRQTQFDQDFGSFRQTRGQQGGTPSQMNAGQTGTPDTAGGTDPQTAGTTAASGSATGKDGGAKSAKA